MQNLYIFRILLENINATNSIKNDLYNEGVTKEYYKLKIHDEINSELESYNNLKKYKKRYKNFSIEEEVIEYKERLKIILKVCNKLCFDVSNLYNNHLNKQKTDMFVIKCIKTILSIFIHPIISPTCVNKIIDYLVYTSLFRCYIMIDDYNEENRILLYDIYIKIKNEMNFVKENQKILRRKKSK
ncbi:uncharacterized protein VNE69_09098 [Vairimorpha necatrix]|uniref:Uncharacterized protein n=1 Tax=Vairimorpha necatrix TaxID=6039 RepID=A0AAX4JFB2_9MICR